MVHISLILFLVFIALSFLFFSFRYQRWITALTVPAKTTEHVKIFQMATTALAVENSKDKTVKVCLAYPFTLSTSNWIESVLFLFLANFAIVQVIIK